MLRSRRILPPLPLFSNLFLPYSSPCWDPTVSLTLSHPTLLLLESCKTPRHFRQILAQMMRLHLTGQTFPMSRLLCFSAISFPDLLLDDAILLFEHFTPSPNPFIFNTMMSALSFSANETVALYKSMLLFRICPNEQSFLCLLKSSDCLLVCKQIHAHVIVNGFDGHVYLQNSLIKVYMECGKLDLACKVFEVMPLRDAASYNVMISGYSKKGCSLEAFHLFHDMVSLGVDVDGYTMVGLLQLCGGMKVALWGRSIHGWVLRRVSISQPCLVLSNALMDMYAKCEEMTSALKVFEGLEKKDVISWNIIISGFSSTGAMDMACSYFREMPIRDLVSWNALFAGLAQMGNWPSVMILFEEMLAHRVKPDRVTNVYLLSAASELGFLDQGRSIHGWLVKVHGNSDAFLGSALIEMYCKCGRTEKGLLVFELITSKDLTSWTAMITGLAFNGHGMKALELFAELLEGGLVPNSVTLISVLSACSHSGLVDQGLRVFSDMKEKYGVEPVVEHYGCLVDLLARSGKIIEARDVIRNMPIKPSKSMWGSILSASRDRGDIRHAKEALEKLVKLSPEDDGGYVLLSNVYASCGRWSYSDEIREIMASRGIKKTVGWSSVAIDGILHYFVSSDKLHQSWDVIHSILSGLHKEMDYLAEF